ncbi:MFS peptide transporter [Teratosphaeria destructans]|uniref:MFS peptide transporter n=1 Tax=Teratosphaeria destructans TaxID=418781 RepID=A0A9W7SP08_9PEZI|nr:MFS peptide transporter [Teratosphaeria destructans]
MEAHKSSFDIEVVRDIPAPSTTDEGLPPPTREQLSTLRRVSGNIPKTAYLLCIVELAERASYHGVKTVFSNFMQYPLPRGGNGWGAPARGSERTAGALGKGLQFSNALSLLFMCLAWIVPLFSGWAADAKTGYWKMVFGGAILGGVAHVVMIVAAIPRVIASGTAVAPFVVSLIMLAVGAGMFKPLIAPTLLDQIDASRPYVKTVGIGGKSEHVIVDPQVTKQSATLYLFAFIHIGAIVALTSTFAERYVGFWLAFVIPSILYFALPLTLWYTRRRIHWTPAKGSKLGLVCRLLSTAIIQSEGRFWRKDLLDLAKPSAISALDGKIDWTDEDVDQINLGGIGTVSTAQAGSLTTQGVPNDLLSKANPIVVLAATPTVLYIINPFLQRRKIRFGKIRRLTLGFTLSLCSALSGALLQWRIYATSPCGFAATTCSQHKGLVSPISLWWQFPIHAFAGLAEVLNSTTAYEIAYDASPDMKALVTALYFASMALSAAAGQAVGPAMHDPDLVWIWAVPGMIGLVQTVAFWFQYRHMDQEAEYTPGVVERKDSQ